MRRTPVRFCLAAILAALSLAPLHAPAFHIQFGVGARFASLPSVYRTNYGSNLSTRHLWLTQEVGAVPGYLTSRNRLNISTTVWWKDSSSGGGISSDPSASKGVDLVWDDVDDTGCVTLYEQTGRTELGTVEIVEAVRADGVQSSVSDIVLTARGDPYSTVFNATEQSLTVNGATIEPHSAVRLKFPVYLRMSAIEGIRFYDLDTLEELSATYSDGVYLLGWTGNVRISTRQDPDNTIAAAADERLLYGDIAEESGNRLLHSANGGLVYSSSFRGTNIALNVWWDFTQSEWGSPDAYVNGSAVCYGHVTGHIIPHPVADGDPHSLSETREIYFTASLSPDESHAGGACAIRCFDATEGDYASTPSNHRAEVEAGLNTATFRLTIGPYGLWWKVEPVL